MAVDVVVVVVVAGVVEVADVHLWHPTPEAAAEAVERRREVLGTLAGAWKLNHDVLTVPWVTE